LKQQSKNTRVESAIADVMVGENPSAKHHPPLRKLSANKVGNLSPKGCVGDSRLELANGW
jgi:hypothetical protein